MPRSAPFALLLLSACTALGDARDGRSTRPAPDTTGFVVTAGADTVLVERYVSAADMRSVLAFLRARPEIDASRVALFGLSEGGQIAPMLASTDTALRGIVLLGAPGTSGREVALYQTRERVAGDPRVRAARRDSAVDAQMRDWLGRAATGAWIREFVRSDPAAVARRVRTPVLVVHGGADRFVPPESPARLGDAFRAGGNQDVTVRVIPGVNHAGYRDVDGGARGEMYVHSLDVAPEVVTAVVDWLVTRLRP